MLKNKIRSIKPVKVQFKKVHVPILKAPKPVLVKKQQPRKYKVVRRE
jgi:hypothetical protein